MRESPLCAFAVFLIALDGLLPILLSLQAPGTSQKWQRPSEPLGTFGRGKCLGDSHSVSASPGPAEGLQSDCSQHHVLALAVVAEGLRSQRECHMSPLKQFPGLAPPLGAPETSRMRLWPFLMPLPPQVPLEAPQLSWVPERLSPDEGDSLAGTALREPVPRV